MTERFSEPIISALSTQLEHGPPFRRRELSKVMSISIDNVPDLRGLIRLSALRVLLIRGYGPTDLAPLRGLMELRSIAIEYGALADLSMLSELRPYFLKLACNSIVDLTAVLQFEPTIERLDVRGNPLSTKSYREMLPALAAKGVELRCSGEREWTLTRELYAMGLPFDYYESVDGNRLCRPGLKYTETPQYNHPLITPDELERVMRSGSEAVCQLFGGE